MMSDRTLDSPLPAYWPMAEARATEVRNFWLPEMNAIVDGILELEDGGLRVTLIKAVVRATHRAKELVNG